MNRVCRRVTTADERTWRGRQYALTEGGQDLINALYTSRPKAQDLVARGIAHCNLISRWASDAVVITGSEPMLANFETDGTDWTLARDLHRQLTAHLSKCYPGIDEHTIDNQVRDLAF